MVEGENKHEEQDESFIGSCVDVCCISWLLKYGKRGKAVIY